MSAEVIALLHKAIALLSGTVNEPAQPSQQQATAAQAAQYLRENPDVAAHAYYGQRPLEHWHMHGRAEGRKWPTLTAPEPVVTHPAWTEPAEATVTTPGGRSFPAPDARENAMGYIQRVGTHIGRQAEWTRVAGTLRLGVNHLVPKSVPYPDGYGPWLDDRANWPTLAEAFWFPVAQATDPGWQNVHDRLRERNEPPPADPPKLPDGETPL